MNNQTNLNNEIIKNNIISIGDSCFYKGQKNIYLKKNNYDLGKTSMFDYILNNLDNVINILELNDINNLFNSKNVTTAGRSNHLILKKGGKFKSIHDIKKYNQYKSPNEYYNDIEINFIKKYIRRYHRFIDVLKNNTQKIIFIYSGNSGEEIKMKKIVNILRDKFNLLKFKIVNLKLNYTDINYDKFCYKKIFDHFYILECNEELMTKNFNSLLFKKLLEIYNNF